MYWYVNCLTRSNILLWILSGFNFVFQSLVIDQTIEKVSFCTPDPSNDRVFSYICREGTTRRWMCHSFIAMRDTVSQNKLYFCNASALLREVLLLLRCISFRKVVYICSKVDLMKKTQEYYSTKVDFFVCLPVLAFQFLVYNTTGNT